MGCWTGSPTRPSWPASACGRWTGTPPGCAGADGGRHRRGAAVDGVQGPGGRPWAAIRARAGAGVAARRPRRAPAAGGRGRAPGGAGRGHGHLGAVPRRSQRRPLRPGGAGWRAGVGCRRCRGARRGRRPRASGGYPRGDLGAGAFAERSAVEVGALAEVPPSVDLAEAAASPVAGVAALRALRAAGAVLGTRVRMSSRRSARWPAARAWPRPAPTRWWLVWTGSTSPSTWSWTTSAARSWSRRGSRLAVEVGWRGAWEQVAEAAQALLGRRVNGKAVLDVRPAAG